MEKEMVSISREEFERLKRIEESLIDVDLDLLMQFKEGLEDLKAGRIRKVA